MSQVILQGFHLSVELINTLITHRCLQYPHFFKHGVLDLQCLCKSAFLSFRFHNNSYVGPYVRVSSVTLHINDSQMTEIFQCLLCLLSNAL